MKNRWQASPGFSLQSGFTLIEILVVMILLGIVMTIAVISIGDTQSEKLEEDMRRLLQISRLTHEEAIINQQTLAIKFSKHGYSIERYDPQGKIWMPVTEPAFFLPKELDESYEIKLLQDGLRVSLETNDNSDEESNNGKVLMYASGEMTPFELIVSLPDSDIHYRLTGDLMGKLEIDDLQAYGGNADENAQ